LSSSTNKTIRSIGIIELNSIARGVETADFMLKAAETSLIFAKTFCPGKFMIMIAGDVGAVKAAVDAGAASAALVGKVLSTHVIPRPMDDVTLMLLDTDFIKSTVSAEPNKASNNAVNALNSTEESEKSEKNIMQSHLENMKITRLRGILHKMDGNKLTAEEIKSASREELIIAINKLQKPNNSK